MSDAVSVKPTEADFQAAGEKLQTFLKGLAPGEQEAIRKVLQEVVAESNGANEVKGYMDSVGGGTEYQVMVDGVLTWVFPESTDTGATWLPVNSPHYHDDL